MSLRSTFASALTIVFLSSLALATDVAAPKGPAPKPPAKPPLKPAISIRYLDEKVHGLKVAETSHFRILHDQDKDIVANVGKVAEDARVALQKRWFGDVSMEWDGRCAIYLHGTLKEYAKKTGQKNALGHMRTMDVGVGIRRSIHVPCKEPRLAAEILPHEVSHSVMAVRFQGQTPRWADEGMAMLAQTPESISECVGMLPLYRKQDNLFALEVLVQTQEQEQMNTLEFYAQSTSLIMYLCKQKGDQEFPKFVRTSLAKGYVPALKQHYGIAGFADLEKRWQAFAFEAKKAAPAKGGK